jgi:uncharacterized protein YutE (UPF0331/DUF86 family)
MQLDELVMDIAAKHISQSLAEVHDPERFAQWKNGERAKHQAEQIAQRMVDIVNVAIENGGKNEN